jgi:orotidine-5'-phosphate decarboxylase
MEGAGSMSNKVIIALDFSSKQEVETFLANFGEEKLYVKVGMELFYKEGNSIITYLKEKGHQIFLDLKLHDIPNTVKSAMRNLARLDVDMVNVHAAGGSKMMRAALEGLQEGTAEGKERPLCIAVTQLTSMTEEVMQKELMIPLSLNVAVVQYAKLAKESGLDGVVCSVHEVPLLRQTCGEEFATVTPGIRLASDSVDDQARVATPEIAREKGSSYIVVGRTITKAANPLHAYKLVKEQMEGQIV